MKSIPFSLMQCLGCGYILRDYLGKEIRFKPDFEAKITCPYCHNDMEMTACAEVLCETKQDIKECGVR